MRPWRPALLSSALLACGSPGDSSTSATTSITGVDASAEASTPTTSTTSTTADAWTTSGDPPATATTAAPVTASDASSGPGEDTGTVPLTIAGKDGQFDYACRRINLDLTSMERDADKLARQSPKELPAQPESVTDAFIWPLKAVSGEVDGQTLSLHECLIAFRPYQLRQRLGAAYSAFQGLQTSLSIDEDFKIIEREIGTRSRQEEWPPLGKREDLRRLITFDCLEWGYSSKELTTEIRWRMSKAHETQATRQFSHLAGHNPLEAKKRLKKIQIRKFQTIKIIGMQVFNIIF